MLSNLLAAPPPEDVNTDMAIPNNTPEPYTFALSKVNATKTLGGSIKVVDSRTFNVAKTIAAAEVTVEVGGMRFVFHFFSLLDISIDVCLATQRITRVYHQFGSVYVLLKHFA